MYKPANQSKPTDAELPRRLRREFETVSKMIQIYCTANHTADSGLCDDCKCLVDYAAKRLKNCPFQEDKPTCGHCTIHCYRSSMKEKIIEIMRFSGPRMIFKHPFLALVHLFDSSRAPRPKITKPKHDLSQGDKKV